MTTWKDGGNCGKIYREIVNEDETHVIAKVRTKSYAYHRAALNPAIPWPEGKTNFALILQAPRMLEALEAIVDLPTDDLWRCYGIATAAIAAVKGDSDEA